MHSPEEFFELKKQYNQREIIMIALNEKLGETERDLKSLQGAHKVKGDRILQLEAEVLRLRMLRTDEQNRIEVEGLRKDVSRKDSEISRLSKRIAELQDREKELLFRAHEADRRAQESADRLSAFQATCEAMQRDRDAAIRNLAAVAEEAKKIKAEAEKAVDVASEGVAEAKKVLAVRDLAAKAISVLPSSMRGLKEVRDLDAVIKGKPIQEPPTSKKKAIKAPQNVLRERS